MSYQSILSQSAVHVAPRLLGCELECLIDGKTVRVKIVETEAYDESDAASHSFGKRTPRADIMFGPAGHLYVYFTYGMHYCCNVVTDKDGSGSAVLIRAVQPLSGTDIMEEKRGRSGVELSNGPAKLCQALGITKKLNGHDLAVPPVKLVMRPALSPDLIQQTTRIGIKQSIDLPWRFYIKDNPYVSKR